MLKIITKFRTFLFLAYNYPRRQQALRLQKIAQTRQQISIFGKALHKNLLGAIERRLDIGKACVWVEVICSDNMRVENRIR